jgi:hypothetical protein
MLQEADFLLNGYKRFDGGSAQLKFANYLLQRCVRDDVGKKYYITVYVYDYSQYNHPHLKGLSFMPEVQFREEGVCPTIDVTYHDDESTTLESLEAFFDSMWAHLGKPYDERYG